MSTSAPMAKLTIFSQIANCSFELTFSKLFIVSIPLSSSSSTSLFPSSKAIAKELNAVFLKMPTKVNITYSVYLDSYLQYQVLVSPLYQLTSFFHRLKSVFRSTFLQRKVALFSKWLDFTWKHQFLRFWSFSLRCICERLHLIFRNYYNLSSL